MAGRDLLYETAHCLFPDCRASSCSSVSVSSIAKLHRLGPACRRQRKAGQSAFLVKCFRTLWRESGCITKLGQVCKCLNKGEKFTTIEGSKIEEDDHVSSSLTYLKLGKLQEETRNPAYGLNDDMVLDAVDFPDVSIFNAVVKVYCISAEPDYSLPWQLRRQYASSGSGFMIAGKRLLTNAHCVEHHTQVKVKKTGDDTKYIATVLAIGVECDIALLSVENEDFWKDAQPLRFGGLPHLQDAVTVVGYPVGGDTISVTRGVVSRIEVASYAHADSELLALQIDAAINPGNSGGPAFNDNGDCVGIAFQTISDVAVENIGYVIPTTVVSHFLTDYQRNGHYTGIPALGVTIQKLENPDLRNYLKMKPTQKGILVKRIEPTSPSKNVIEEGDVLLSFDGIPIANEATVPFRPGERIAFAFLVSQKFTGDQAEIGILRDGKEIKVKTVLRRTARLVPIHLEFRHPSYFIIAGLVFTPLTQPFIQSEYGMDDVPNIGIKVLAKARHDMAKFEGEELVVLSQVLAHCVNIGYESISHVQVLRFNGIKIQNTRHLAQLVDSCKEQYMRFELDDSILIVLETESAHAATPQILKDYCIPRERSEDLLNPFNTSSLLSIEVGLKSNACMGEVTNKNLNLRIV